MSNKVFIFLVVVLSILIICSFVALLMSLSTYHSAKYPNEKPSVLVEGSNIPKKTESVDNTEDGLVPEKDYQVSGFILPSNERLITNKDLEGMDRETLNKAYNEIFARYGHDFKSEDLKAYFTKTSWYTPTTGRIVGLDDLTDIEKQNVTIIKNKIDEISKSN